MSKIRNITQLGTALTDELAWRIQEIQNVRMAIKRAEELPRKTLLRASLALLYAHWEGFIKNSAEHYLNFVCHQGHKYADLKPCLIAFGLKTSLQELVASNKHSKRADALSYILEQIEQRANIQYDGSIRSEGNLGVKVFFGISAAVGLDLSSLQSKIEFIELKLVKKRHEIAHGDFAPVEQDEFFILCDEAIFLMRTFQTELENSAVTGGFKKPIRAVTSIAPSP